MSRERFSTPVKMHVSGKGKNTKEQDKVIEEFLKKSEEENTNAAR